MCAVKCRDSEWSRQLASHRNMSRSASLGNTASTFGTTCLLWLELCSPQKDTMQSYLSPGCALFGNEVLAGVISKIDHTGGDGPYTNRTAVLTKEGIGTHARIHEDSTMSRLELCCHKPSDCQKLGERAGIDVSSTPSKGGWPCRHRRDTLGSHTLLLT